jgi:hypothetical protein
MFRLGNARYHGKVKHRQDVFDAFFPRDGVYDEWQREAMEAFPEDSQILFAAISEDLDGYDLATVLFLNQGKLMLSVSSDDPEHWDEPLPWDPCHVSWMLLWEDYYPLRGHDVQANEAWIALVGHNVTSAVEIVGEEEDGRLTVTRKLSGSGKQFMLVPVEFIRQQQLEEG